jgi:hypothetical protein
MGCYQQNNNNKSKELIFSTYEELYEELISNLTRINIIEKIVSNNEYSDKLVNYLPSTISLNEYSFIEILVFYEKMKKALVFLKIILEKQVKAKKDEKKVLVDLKLCCKFLNEVLVIEEAFDLNEIDRIRSERRFFDIFNLINI